MSDYMKKALSIAMFLLVIGLISSWLAGSYLSAPVNHKVVMPNNDFEPIQLNNTRGSLLRTEQVKKCALLLHGVRSDRTSMIERSEFLRTIGITSVLIDMQAHGETPGENISFGYFEAIDAANGFSYLKNEVGCEKIIVIGQSLGGAAALLGSVAIDADALILESVYPTIEEAVTDRIESRLGALGKLLAPLLYYQIPLRINVPLEKLRPIESLKNIKAPVFIIGGSLDLSTKVTETIRMYDSTNSKKQIWIVDGATHQDMYAYAKQEYESRVSDFIIKVL